MVQQVNIIKLDLSTGKAQEIADYVAEENSDMLQNRKSAAGWFSPYP